MPVWHEFYKYMTQEAPPPLVLIVVLGIALLVMGVFAGFMWFFSRLAARMVVRQIFGNGEHDLESVQDLFDSTKEARATFDAEMVNVRANFGTELAKQRKAMSKQVADLMDDVRQGTIPFVIAVGTGLEMQQLEGLIARVQPRVVVRPARKGKVEPEPVVPAGSMTAWDHILQDEDEEGIPCPKTETPEPPKEATPEKPLPKARAPKRVRS